MYPTAEIPECVWNKFYIYWNKITIRSMQCLANVSILLQLCLILSYCNQKLQCYSDFILETNKFAVKKNNKKNIFLVLHNYAQFCFGLSQKTKDMEQIKIQIKTKYDTIQVYSDWPKVHVIQAQATLLAQEKVKGASYTFRKNMQETFTFWLLYVWVFLFLFCSEMSWDHICCKLVLYN